MTETERFLKEKWFAQRSIGRLMMDLSLAKRAYQESYAGASLTCDLTKVRSGQHSNLSPVEYSAVLVVDHFRAEMESIEKRLAAERRRAELIEQAVKRAELEPREEEYVRLRYFENRSVEATAQRLYCSLATCGRIRENALRKVEQRGGACLEA
jgi:DNA-directed RNA polymerase specialized sigma subunit